jgi:hypothetical protein
MAEERKDTAKPLGTLKVLMNRREGVDKATDDLISSVLVDQSQG